MNGPCQKLLSRAAFPQDQNVYVPLHYFFRLLEYLVYLRALPYDAAENLVAPQDFLQAAYFVFQFPDRIGVFENGVEKLRVQGPSRDLLRRLQRFTVSLSRRDVARARDSGLLEELAPGFWHWRGKYDPEFGLDLWGAGWAVEDLYQ